MKHTIKDEASGKILIVDDFEGTFQDLAPAVAFKRELEHMKSKTYDVKRADIKWRDIFPVSNEAIEGSEFITYTSFDAVGMAKIITSYSDDVPMVDVGGKQETSKVVNTGIGAEWTQREVRQGAITGRPLNSRKLQASAEASDRLFDVLAFEGSDGEGVIGLLNNPNIPVSSVATSWDTATPDEIIDDVLTTMSDINDNTNGVEAPNRLLISQNRYHKLVNTRIGSVNDTTILEYVAKTSPYLSGMDDIIPIPRLNGKGAGGSDIMVAYEYNADKLEAEEVMPLKYLPEQLVNFKIKVLGEAEFGGVNVYYPLSVNIVEGL